jgi:hypothetical protein
MRSPLVLVVLVGCVESPPSFRPPTITQGAFGQVHNGCDTPDCAVAGSIGVGVAAFADAQVVGQTSQNYTALDVTDDHGQYELALPVGTFYVCIGEAESYGFVPQTPCETASIASQRLDRLDYAYGPGGGRWYRP